MLKWPSFRIVTLSILLKAIIFAFLAREKGATLVIFFPALVGWVDVVGFCALFVFWKQNLTL